MANKQILSVVAATVLAASFTLTGCGSSSSKSSSSSSTSSSTSSSSTSSSSTSSSSTSSSPASSSSVSSSSSSVAPSTIVRVSDAYVVPGANTVVKAGEKEFTHYIGEGQYEVAENNVTGILMISGGINDANGNDAANDGESFAPTMKAPEGYANINPFTTMMIDNNKTTADLAATYPSAAAVAEDFDFDVVAAGLNSLHVAKEAAIAALTLSGEQNGIPVSSSSSSSSSVCSNGGVVLPGGGNTCETPASSSSSSSAVSSIGGVLPRAYALRGILPDEGNTGGTVTPSSSSVPSSSSTGILPDQGDGSSSSSSSSTSNVVTVAIAEINVCADSACVASILEETLALINGAYTAPVSSSSEVASSVSSLSQAEMCVANGGTWIAEVNACTMPSTSSSSSVVTSSSSTGGVLPGA